MIVNRVAYGIARNDACQAWMDKLRLNLAPGLRFLLGEVYGKGYEAALYDMGETIEWEEDS